MKKVLLTVLLSAGLLSAVIAQTNEPAKGKFGFTLDAGIPFGTFATYYNFVLGGAFRYEYRVAPNTAVSLSAGYKSLIELITKSDVNIESIRGYVPIKAGLKQNLTGRFFGEIQLGAVIQDSDYEKTILFAYALGAGYAFGRHFEADIRYEGWAGTGAVSQVALGMTVNF